MYQYLNGKFPTIFNLCLASLQELDTAEKEFIYLLEKLPQDEQEAYAKEVYNNGFSQDLLDNLKHWQKKEEAPSLKVAYPWRSEQRIWGSPLYVFGTTDASPAVKVTVNEEEVTLFDYRKGLTLNTFLCSMNDYGDDYKQRGRPRPIGIRHRRRSRQPN